MSSSSPSRTHAKRLRDCDSGGAAEQQRGHESVVPQKRQVKKKKESPPLPSSKTITTKRTWEESFQALQAYKNDNGDCNVPAKFPQDRSLGQWVEKIRRGAIPLSDEQRQRLTTDLGFNWETLEQRIEREWNEKFNRLRRYKLQYGDCRVPAKGSKKIKDDDDPAMARWAQELGDWVRRLRSQYQQNRLGVDRQRKLQGIGFEWSLNARRKEPDTTKKDVAWLEQYEKLVKFKQTHSHCMVTLTYEDTGLFHWVKRQREVYARSSMRPDRCQLLDDLDFCWETNDTNANKSHNQRQWDSMFALLEKYKRQHGHVDVPRTNGKRGHADLSSWLDHQKVYWRRGQLHSERVERLSAIGVCKEKKKAPL